MHSSRRMDVARHARSSHHSRADDFID